MDNFAEYPESIGEITSKHASEWTPREVLIHTLRKLDRGEINPDALTVCFRNRTGSTEEEADTRFASAGPDIQTTIGLLTMTIDMILHP